MKRRKLLLVLCVVLCNMNICTAFALGYGEGTAYSLSVKYYGGNDSTNQVKKTTSNETKAAITVTSISGTGAYPLIARVRKGSSAATVTKSIKNVSSADINFKYLDGMSKKGDYYFLRAQTNSSSSIAGKMSGYWRP